MTRTTRILVHGAGAVLILALILAPVWDAWRYRDMRSGVTSRVPLAILLAPERGRTPALASIGGDAFRTSPIGRIGAGSGPPTAMEGSGRRPDVSGGANRWSWPAADAAVSGNAAATSPAEMGGSSASGIRAEVAAARNGDGRAKRETRKPGDAIVGPRPSDAHAPSSQAPPDGSRDDPSGGANTALLLGPGPAGTDVRNVAPPQPPPGPTTPVRVAGGSSVPRDPEIPAVQQPEVSLVADQASLAVGDPLTVTVNVQAGDHVTSVPFHLLFDPAVLEFSDGSTDPSLGSKLQPVLLASVSPNRPGDLAVGLSFIESAGSFTGSGGIVVLHFRAIGSGDTDLQFSRASLRGATSQPLAAAFHNSRVSVH